MTGRCCTGGRPSRRLVRRLSGAATSLLPGAVLVLLPKCPLCLAAWIAACTGVALPTVVASSVRPSLVIASVLSASLLVRRAMGRFRSAEAPVRTAIAVAYSWRKALDGSSAAARRAGIQVANAEMARNSAAIPAKVSGSFGLMPISMLVIACVSKSPPVAPMTVPTAASRRPYPIISPKIP